MNNSAVIWWAVSKFLSEKQMPMNSHEIWPDQIRQFWNPSIISEFQGIVQEFQSEYWLQNLMANPSDDWGILMEFFRNFDQNSDGKYPFF